MNVKENYVVHIRFPKKSLNHGFILTRVDRVIHFNQKAWLKSLIKIHTKLRAEAKNGFENDFFKLIDNAFSGKPMENVRKYRDFKLVTDKRRNELLSEFNYHTTKWFSENLLVIEIKKTKVKMNMPVYQACQHSKLVKH